MGTKAAPLKSDWLRREYEVVDGMIRARPGSLVHRYDPWAEYEEARMARKGAKAAPYQDLQRLIRAIDSGADPREEVAAWCTRYGLLGLNVQPMSLAPIGDQIAEIAWPELRTLFSQPVEPSEEAGLKLALEKLGRHFQEVRKIDPATRRQMAEALRADGATEAEIAIIVADIDALAPDRSHSIDRATNDFMNLARRSVQEPLEAFLEEARKLDAIVEALYRIAKNPRAATMPAVSDALAYLDLILREHVAGGVEIDGRTVRQRWVFRSLLGCLAQMIFLDALDAGGEGRRTWRPCEHCKIVFAARVNYGQKHCSGTCREAAKYASRKAARRAAKRVAP